MRLLTSHGLEISIGILWSWFQAYLKVSIFSMLTILSLLKFARLIPIIAFALSLWLTWTYLELASPIPLEVKNTAINQFFAIIITIHPLLTWNHSWRPGWKTWIDWKLEDCFLNSTLLMLRGKRILPWWTNVTIIFKAGLAGYILFSKNTFLVNFNHSTTFTLSSMMKIITLIPTFQIWSRESREHMLLELPDRLSFRSLTPHLRNFH